MKEDMALQLSTGSINVLQCEDVFEGLSPEVRVQHYSYSAESSQDSLLVLNRWPIMQEVSDYVDSTRNKRIRGLHSQADEFDGLSPDEINQLGQ